MNLLKRLSGNVTFQNIIYAYVIKGVSVMIGVLLVRAYMRYFQETEILGIWYTILSVVTWLINFDLGIGQGLRNAAAKTLANGDYEQTKRIVSSGYMSIGVLSIVLLLISSVCAFVIDWNKFFNVSTKLIASHTLQVSVFITFAGIIFQMILRLIASLFNALERTALSNALTLSTNLIVVLFVTLYHGGSDSQNLIALTMIFFVAATTPYFIASLVAYGKKLRAFRPSLKCAEKTICMQLMSLSNRFFIAQILLMVITVTNEAFITKLVGVDQVVVYQVYFRIFSTILLMFSLTTNAVWSSVTKKWQLRDYVGTVKSAQMLVASAAVFTVIATVISFILQPIINIWLGKEAILIDGMSTGIFLFYTSVMLFSYALAAIANAISKLNMQIVCYFVAAVLKYPLCMILLRFNYSWSSIVLANAILMLPLVLLQPIALIREFRKLKTIV